MSLKVTCKCDDLVGLIHQPSDVEVAWARHNLCDISFQGRLSAETGAIGPSLRGGAAQHLPSTPGL